MDAYPDAGPGDDADGDDDVTPEPYRRPRTACPDARVRLGAVPLFSTIVTLPLAGLAWVFAAASGMACDPCEGAEADAFDSSFTAGFRVLEGAIGVASAVLLAAWMLPLRERYRNGRTLLALSAPVVVLVGYLAFTGLVDWPSGWG